MNDEEPIETSEFCLMVLVPGDVLISIRNPNQLAESFVDSSQFSLTRYPLAVRKANPMSLYLLYT